MSYDHIHCRKNNLCLSIIFLSPYKQKLKRVVQFFLLTFVSRRRISFPLSMYKFATTRSKEYQTLLRSPHVNKNAQESFGISLYFWRYQVMFKNQECLQQGHVLLKKLLKKNFGSLSASWTLTKKFYFSSKF